MIFFIDWFFIIVMVCAILVAILGIASSILGFLENIFLIIKGFMFSGVIAAVYGCHVYIIAQLLLKKNKKYLKHLALLIICDIALLVSFPFIQSKTTQMDLDNMNKYSQIAYNSISGYLDLANEEVLFDEDYVSLQDLFDGEELKKANSDTGLTVYNKYYLQIKSCDDYISNTLSQYTKKYDLVVYVGLMQNNNEFYVQVKDKNHPEVIGQYPKEISAEDMDKVVWTEYYP